jgi:RNA recognition motif-containing protein
LGGCSCLLVLACRTGDSRGFAFVRYNYEDEAQKAVDGLDGRENFHRF